MKSSPRRARASGRSSTPAAAPNRHSSFSCSSTSINWSEASAKAISNIKFDKVVVWEGNGANGSATANWLHNMARTLPPMMQVMKDIGGVELPDTLINLGTTPRTPAPSAASTEDGNAHAKAKA